jgi:hypothetical protein
MQRLVISLLYGASILFFFGEFILGNFIMLIQGFHIFGALYWMVPPRYQAKHGRSW